MITRREFGKIALAGVALPRFLEANVDSKIAGVRLGAQTYSGGALVGKFARL